MSYDNTLPPERRLTGYHVLAAFVGFFLIVFAMNGVMVYQAVTTFGGLETTDAYRKGLAYNERIAEADMQTRLGWAADVSVAANNDGVTIRMTDQAAQPLPALTISGTIGRATTNRFDRPITLREVEPGVYTSAGGDQLEAGTWVVNLSAMRAVEGNDEQRLTIRRRVWVTP
jgi:nitrogen fixation protein FixH